jgi:hypothetical protein
LHGRCIDRCVELHVRWDLRPTTKALIYVLLYEAISDCIKAHSPNAACYKGLLLPVKANKELNCTVGVVGRCNRPCR